MSEQQIPVFIDHPNEAALVIYTAITGFTIESNNGGIVKVESEATKVTVFLKPERQILTLKAPGFIEKKLSIENLSAKQATFYRVNGTEGIYTTETGLYSIQSMPAGALLKIEGIPTFKQLTPFELKDFKAGKYRINLTKPDYYSLDTLIEIRSGMKQSGLFEMKSMYGTVSIRTVLPVKVKLGDQTIDAGPDLSNLRLRDGKYELTVNDSRFDLYNETILVESGKTKILDLPLVKRAGFLQIMHPDEFDFKVNGETQFKKPGTHLFEFFEGRYEAEIKRPGFQLVTFSFIIKKGEVVNWEPVFTAATVKVNLETEPSGATVLLNRGSEQEVLGFTPLEEQIAVGEVEFLIRKEGAEDYQFETTLEEGKAFSRKIDLGNLDQNGQEEPELRSASALLYAGWSNVWFASDNFKTLEKDGEIKRTPVGLALGYRRWIGEGNFFFADGMAFILQPVKTNLDAPADHLFLSGLSLAAGWNPMGISWVRPQVSLGWGFVNFGEEAFIFQSGEALSIRQLFWGIGIDFLFEEYGFGLEFRRSLDPIGDRTINQIQLRGGIGL